MTRYLTIAAAALAIGMAGVSADANAGGAASAAARPMIDGAQTAEQVHYRNRYRYRSYRRSSPGIYFYFGTPRYYRPNYYSGRRYYRHW